MKPGRTSLLTSLRTVKLLVACVLAITLVTGGRALTTQQQQSDESGPALQARSLDESEPVDESEAAELEAKLEAAGPDSAESETAESDAAESETAESETAESDAAESDAAESDAAESESVQKLPPVEGPTPRQPPEPVQQPQTVGEPLAPGMVTLLQREIMAGLTRRNITSKFSRFRGFAGAKLNATARYSGSELTGNCRLQWYDHLMRHPLEAAAEAETFTRSLHRAVLDEQDALARTLEMAAEKLDLRPRRRGAFPLVNSPQQALEVIRQSLAESQLAYCAALAPLSKREIRTLSSYLYPILTSDNRVGHTLQRRGTGRHLCNLLEKLDRNSMHAAAEALAPIAAPDLLDRLAELPDEASVSVAGVKGTVVRRIDTSAGAIVVGGKGQNAYYLDKMPGVSVVIDLGGDDAYFEGTVSQYRPVLIVIDLAGNDGYRGTKPGVQGAGMMGISMLLDRSGNDVYQAKDVAQGSCLAGAGILIDYQGNDAYIGIRRVQGEALGGVGLLIDRHGDDRYHAAMWAQGFGGPLGFGLLDDLEGKDRYYGGGLYLNSYLDDENPTPGYEGWSQGVGSGLRGVANGGIGVVLDGGGDDVYEYDYLSHGGGYWCGTGFARDFGGNDKRLGATQKAYHGGNRTQRRFQRFGNGFGCHYALGFLFDDRGDDTYNGSIMCLGFAWDCAVGYLFDFGGNDRYSGTEGNGAQAGLGVIFDYDGDDVYRGSRQGRASAGISYHSLPQCGGNFGFVVDYGGTDKYGCGAKNNSYIRRSSSGGFLIDRPKQSETGETTKNSAKPAKPAKTATKPARQTTAGS